MKREIKFRGLNKENNQWLYGYFFKYPNGRNVICESDISYGEVCPSSVGQYTGLKDDSGKEIYEGDIVSILYWKGVVVYDNEFASFKIRCGGSNMDIKFFFAYGGKIIGNIHGNPELLQ